MVNIVLVERILNDIKAHLNYLRTAEDITWERYRTDIRARRFVEGPPHILIDACIDIAQHLVADENMREPQSYRDTLVVLAEHDIQSPDALLRFEAMASFRDVIVHYYEKIDDALVYGVFKQRLSDFHLFVDCIVNYLVKKTED